MLVNAAFSGLIDGLTINDIEVAPLIVAEMDRRYPERARLFARDPAGLAPHGRRSRRCGRRRPTGPAPCPTHLRRARVDDEWSFIETLRHLVFVTDGWISRTVLGEARPYHRLGLPPSFVTDLGDVGIDGDADPTFEEVVDAREARLGVVRDLLDSITADELARHCEENPSAGYPPETTSTVLECVHVVIDEEWAHHFYAVRDLEKLTSS